MKLTLLVEIDGFVGNVQAATEDIATLLDLEGYNVTSVTSCTPVPVTPCEY